MKSSRKVAPHASAELVRRVQRAAGRRAKGKIAAIDVASGKFFLGSSVIEAAETGRERLGDPRRQFYFIRIGFDAVHWHHGVSRHE